MCRRPRRRGFSGDDVYLAQRMASDAHVASHAHRKRKGPASGVQTEMSPSQVPLERTANLAARTGHAKAAPTQAKPAPGATGQAGQQTPSSPRHGSTAQSGISTPPATSKIGMVLGLIGESTISPPGIIKARGQSIVNSVSPNRRGSVGGAVPFVGGSVVVIERSPGPRWQSRVDPARGRQWSCPCRQRRRAHHSMGCAKRCVSL